MSEFDDRYTAPDGGYASGADYYERAGACRVLETIAVPTLIITAQDDPFIPYSMFTVPLIQHHSKIRVIAPRHGGHCGFLQWARNGEDHFWAENRIMDFLQERM
jgi:predicted alpha/beta-fold hydrolase